MSEENVTRESELRQPDAAFIRQHIPVEEIAEALGIEVTSKDFARCWRAAHPTGDREPSLHFHLNRTRCFLCDDHDFSNVDLVMKFTGLSFRSGGQLDRTPFSRDSRPWARAAARIEE